MIMKICLFKKYSIKYDQTVKLLIMKFGVNVVEYNDAISYNHNIKNTPSKLDGI